jgi:hypothetical protein
VLVTAGVQLWDIRSGTPITPVLDAFDPERRGPMTGPTTSMTYTTSASLRSVGSSWMHELDAGIVGGEVIEWDFDPDVLMQRACCRS